jgi:hypothetical protein
VCTPAARPARRSRGGPATPPPASAPAHRRSGSRRRWDEAGRDTAASSPTRCGHRWGRPHGCAHDVGDHAPVSRAPPHLQGGRSGRAPANISVQTRIDVQGCTRSRPSDTARNGRLQALRPCPSVASPGNGRCCIAVVLLLMCACTILDSADCHLMVLLLLKRRYQPVGMTPCCAYLATISPRAPRTRTSHRSIPHHDSAMT